MRFSKFNNFFVFMQEYSQEIFIGSFILGLLIIAFLMLSNSKEKTALNKLLGKTKVKKRGIKFNFYAQKSYNQLVRIPGIRNFVFSMRKRLETLAVYDEYTLRREVMKIIFTVVAIIAVIVGLLLLIRPAVMIVFWVLLGLIFLIGVFVDFFIYRVETRLLEQTKDFNNRQRFYYQQTYMIDDAIYEAMAHVGPEMKVQADRIYKILTAVDPEKELSVYEEVAPTRFLKVIAGLSLLVKEQGDKITEKGSAYLSGLADLNEELNDELLYRRRLSYILYSLGVLTLIPIFFAYPLKLWSITTFPVTERFYDSILGFVFEILVYLTALGCYLIARRMKRFESAPSPMSLKRVKWEAALFKRIPLLERVCSALSPTPYTKKYFRFNQLIKESNTPYKMEWIMLHRILIVIFTVILLTGGLYYAHERNKHNALNNTMPETLFAGKPTQEELTILSEQTEFDKEVIAAIENYDGVVSDEDLAVHIATMMGLDVTDAKVKVAKDRIANKWSVVNNAFIKWWQFAFVIIIAFAASFIPYISMIMKRKLRFEEMEREVHQHLILIAILREFDNMTVFGIISWQERFSVVFKEPLQIALHKFDAGQDEALKELQENVPYEGFQNIVERLRLAVERISVYEAFDDIHIEREYYLSQRKVSQDESLNSKRVYSEFVGLAPLIVLIFLYLVFPIIYISVVEAGNTMSLLR